MTDIENEAHAAADDRFPESPLAPENEQRAEDFEAGYVAGASRPAPAEVSVAVIRQAKAEAWDEATAAIYGWWTAPEDERGPVVNPYGVLSVDHVEEALRDDR